MREKRVSQLRLSHTIPQNEIGKELEAISRIIEANPAILDRVLADLIVAKCSTTGRKGMTAEQVLRCALLKQWRVLSYEELAFHLEDSRAFRAFARLSGGRTPSTSTLQTNIKSLSEGTWEVINQNIVCYAAREDMEQGRKVRMDSTGVESNIHYPADSTLLQDAIRVITRWLANGKDLCPVPDYPFSDHSRRVKKRVLQIQNSRKDKERRKAYQDLLLVAELVLRYALRAIPVLKAYESELIEEQWKARMIGEKLEEAVCLFDRLVDQTERRVIRGEKVPAAEKLVSFFESHTDIIEKGDRETLFGHKLFLAGGGSGLILDCVIERGNPADSEMFKPLVERQKQIFNRAPRQTSADGGFASQENLKWAKEKGIKDVSFSKRRGISVLDMVKSNWVYKQLRNFRAGIEANISRLKRAFGLSRCTWRGWEGFRRYVWSAVVAYNLSVLARLKMAQA
ncbi:MAG: ISNCY family transposase [Desulfoferrobacter sp.]